MVDESQTAPERSIKRLDLFDIATMAFGRDKIILKSKRGRSHFTLSFRADGIDVHRTFEGMKKSYVPLLKMSRDGFEKRMGELFLQIFSKSEIDPSDACFQGWIALIPKTTSLDSSILSQMFIEKGRQASMTLEPILARPRRILRELYDTIPLADVKGQSFKWALVYPTRKLSPRTVRYLYSIQGRYFMISKRKLFSSFRQVLGPLK